MAVSSQDRAGRVAGALGGALVLAGLGVLLTPGARRGLGAAMAALGLLVGVAVAAAGLLPGRRAGRSPIERLNDAAFVVVLSVVSLLLGITARPWTTALPGLAGGLLAGRVLRRPAARDIGEPPGDGAAPGSDPSSS